MMVQQTPDDIERELDAGAWLSSGQISTLLHRGRTTIWRRLQRGDIRSRQTPGGRSEWHPEDVRKLVDELRTIHGGAGE
jgi:IS30 family transposase